MYFLSVRKQHAGGARRGRRGHFKGAETQKACGGGCSEPAEVACLTQVAADYLIGQQEAKHWGTAHGSIVPYQAFKTKDGYLIVGAGNNQQFATVCKILNLPELIDDSMYRTNHLRVQNRNELIKILSTRCLNPSVVLTVTRGALKDGGCELLELSAGERGETRKTLSARPHQAVIKVHNHPEALCFQILGAAPPYVYAVRRGLWSEVFLGSSSAFLAV
ncbi:uncharacterized protein [Vicugna pacos]|uniref:Uncharacterized protein n=1 Tax=Vicugna pacos TaxID=30538 RepID=A0ABM5CJ21_VICPA